MAEKIENGTKVKYTQAGKNKTGIVHGYRTYEDDKGVITKITYLVVELPSGKKKLNVTEQHEQIEIEQSLIETA